MDQVRELTARSVKRGVQREVIYHDGGARFFMDGETVMFGFKSSVNSDFVRKATEQDREQHPEAWKAFRKLRKS